MSSADNENIEKAGVTDLLQSLPNRENQLYELVYGNLRAIANNRLAAEHNSKTLDTTELVNEAYLKLVQQKCTWRDRRHFFGVAADAMRRILIDAARSRNRLKRGGGMTQQPLSGISLPDFEWETDMLGLDEALKKLNEQSPEHAEVVRLKFFSGLSFQECSSVLQVSLSTIERRWRFARAWLHANILENN